MFKFNKKTFTKVLRESISKSLNETKVYTYDDYDIIFYDKRDDDAGWDYERLKPTGDNEVFLFKTRGSNKKYWKSSVDRETFKWLKSVLSSRSKDAQAQKGSVIGDMLKGRYGKFRTITNPFKKETEADPLDFNFDDI